MSAAKRRGSQFETDLVQWLRDHAYKAERLRLNGREDEGDVWVWDYGDVIIECKAPGAGQPLDLPGYIREARTEAINWHKHRKLDSPVPEAIVVVKAPNKPISESYVVQRLADYFDVVE